MHFTRSRNWNNGSGSILDNRLDTVIDEQDLSPFWRAVVRYGLAIVVAFFYITIVLHYSYTPDDTYIYLQYARNIAGGDGFSFNPNSPSYGVTGPLWALLIAAGVKSGLDPFIVAKTFDILFASLSIVVVYVLSVSLIRDRVYAFIAALVFSLDAWFLRWSASGMETSLAVLLVLLTVRYAYEGDYLIAGFVAGLLTLVRPEGVLLFLVIQLENSITSYFLRKGQRLLWIGTALYLIVVVPWLLYSLMRFGSMVPNTQLAKSATSFSLIDFFGTLVASATILGSTQLVAIVLLLFGVPFVVRNMGIGHIIGKMLPLLWILGLPLGYAVLNVQVVSRYLVPLIPLIIIYAFWCFKQLELVKLWKQERAYVFLSIVALACILQSQLVYRIKVVPHMKSFSIGMEEGIKPIALWLRTNTPDTATVLTPDVGLLGYLAHRRFFDTAGLVSPDVRRAFGALSYEEGMKRRLYRSVIKPDYIVDRSSVPARLTADSVRPIMTSEFIGLGIAQPDSVYYTLYRIIQ